MQNRQEIVGIITNSPGKSGKIPIKQLISILTSFDYNVCIIGLNIGFDNFKKNNKIVIDNLKFKLSNQKSNKIIRLLILTLNQIFLSIKIITKKKKINLWFSLLDNKLIFPIITLKILNKKILRIVTGSPSKSSKSVFNYIINKFLESNINHISDFLIIYSLNIIEEFNLHKFKSKLIIAPHQYVNLDDFFCDRSINNRKYTIGFVGRFGHEKGILNLLLAIKILSLRYNHNYRYLIIGDGFFQDIVTNFVKKNYNEIKIKYLNWIDHIKLNSYLNELKLLLIPSYTEGLPNIMLEGMATGTIIVSTKVGSIPDIITDGKNGFLLKNNNPSSISKKVIEILKLNNLDTISKKSIQFIKNYYSFNEIRKKYFKILNMLKLAKN